MQRRVLLRVVYAAAISLAISSIVAGCDVFDDDDEARADPVTRTAQLNGDQETPPARTGATGTGTLTVDRNTRKAEGSITIDGMAVTAAHIHTGDAGVAGPIEVPLVQTAPNVWSVPANATLTEAQFAAFEAGRLYFNAHSTAFPNGEIRGQIGREVFRPALTGLQENPPVVTTATGRGTFVLDPSNRMLTGSVTTQGVNGNAAHIHPAAVGINGPILIPLSQTAAGSGVWAVPANTVLTEAQVTSLRNGEWYVNVHSAANPAGEIRGQLNRRVALTLLLGVQEVPPNTSTATGRALFAIDPNTRALSGQTTTSGLAGNAAHIHTAPVGENGPITIPLAEAPPAGSGTWVVGPNTNLTAEQFKTMQDGGMYVNVHSAQFPGGEIRGQLIVD